MDENYILNEYKSGRKTRMQLAAESHVQVFAIEQICKGLPTNRMIRKILNTDGFSEWFVSLYNSTNDLSVIYKQCLTHPFFSRIKKGSIPGRVAEIRKYFNLPPKMPENVYESQYDRIRGYIIRNSKYMAKRREIPFDLKYTDFELPEYCPILNVKLEYGAGNNGNSPYHATLDRIDNSKGYIKGNVMVISRLANAMKNEASFEQLKNFITNYSYLLDNINE